MPEFVQYSDSNGRIIEKWYSVDPSVVDGLPNVIQITRSQYHALTKYWIVENDAVREMTQAEKDALDAEEAQAIIDAETARIDALDDKVSKVKIADVSLTKVDTAIDNIANLADAKAFLKKLCRYIIKYVRNN